MKLAKRSTNFSYFELIDACQEPGCPLCRLGHRAARRHLANLIYDGVNDVPLRATLRNSYGYCYEHAWMLPAAGESAPLGIAILHRDVLNTLRKRLTQMSTGEEQTSSLKARFGRLFKSTEPAQDPAESRYLTPLESCPACVQRRESELLAYASLLEALGKEDGQMQAALLASDGLCLNHLRQALDAAPNQEAIDALIQTAQSQLDDLIRDLDEFIRKNDHRFRSEKISSSEGESWRRALQRVSGALPD
ncbi:MAG: DUF6062 family protein [Candidatus Promineifilaceae bacterium]